MQSYRVHYIVLSCALLGCLASGVPAVAQEMRRNFLPPGVVVEPASGGGPADSGPALAELLSRASPRVLDPAFPPRPTGADTRLRRAEERFEQGKRLYLGGDRISAKREFDRAIEILLNSKDDPTDAVTHDRRVGKLVEAIYRLDVEGLGSGEPDADPGYDKSPLDEILTLTFPVDPKLRNQVREELAATVSQLPLETSDAVLSFINFFSSERGRKVLRAGLTRQGRYKPLISRILAEEGVPQELIFLAQAESGFLPRAMSHKAAGGMWQFVKSRGQEYGLKQTTYADDRFDPEMATRAAARHLRDLYSQFGDWYLAIAAYNCGPLTVERAVQRTGYADVWELRNRGVLPKETSNYVPIIVAMTIMAKNPRDYGLEQIVQDSPLEYDTVKLEAAVNLPLISDILGIPVTGVREINPALLKNLAPAGYDLHIPRGSASNFVATLEIVPKEERRAWRLHRVEGDEKLDAVCRRYSASLAAVRNANATSLVEAPQPGDLILVPAVYKEPVTTVARKGKSRNRGTTVRTASRTTARQPAAKKTVTKAASPRTASRTTTAKKTPPTPARRPRPNG